MKPINVINSYKCIMSRVDDKPWKPLWKLEEGANINNAICDYCAKNYNRTYESRIFEYATFPKNGMGWDGSAVTLPMPSDWKWLGKECTLAVATVTRSIEF